MTTTRTRRSKSQQARDMLRALLDGYEAAMLKLQEKQDALDMKAMSVRRALEALDSMRSEADVNNELLPDLATTVVGSGQPLGATMTPAQMAIGTKIAEALGNHEAVPNDWRKPHRRRIGEKASPVEMDDVWPNNGRSSSGNLSPLMESRKAKCSLCLGGIPFATQARLEHYVVTSDEQGIERGFEYQPCKGIRTFDVATKDFGKGDA